MFRISQKVIDSILRHSLEDFPHEACGLLIGTANTILDARPTTNVALQKTNRYIIDPFEMIKIEEEVNLEGLDLIGTYHSHPDNSNVLSSVDLESALPNWLYLLISTDGIRCSFSLWKLHDRGFKRQDFEILSTSGL